MYSLQSERMYVYLVTCNMVTQSLCARLYANQVIGDIAILRYCDDESATVDATSIFIKSATSMLEGSATGMLGGPATGMLGGPAAC